VLRPGRQQWAWRAESRVRSGSKVSGTSNAIARFDQVEGVSDEERDQAWQRIRAAAGKYDVHVGEGDWRDLFARSKNEKKQ
jgi:hypothetical protein